MERRHSMLMIAAGFATLAVPQLTAHAQVRDINDAINKAGRQRMLSQRMAKSYMALGQKLLTDHAEKVMTSSMALFDRELVELKAFPLSPENKATYAQLETVWADYKAALVGAAPNKNGADLVLGLSGKVVSLANQGAMQLESVSGKSQGRLVNISGRQRMLSQRMAAFYLSSSWGVQSAQASAEIAKARDEFVKAHEVLKSAQEATGAIKAELQLAETQFNFFDAALRTLRPGARDVQAQADVFTTSERILQVMDGVTSMYSKLT